MLVTDGGFSTDLLQPGSDVVIASVPVEDTVDRGRRSASLYSDAFLWQSAGVFYHKDALDLHLSSFCLSLVAEARWAECSGQLSSNQ